MSVGGIAASTIDGNGHLKFGADTVFDVEDVTGSMGPI